MKQLNETVYLLHEPPGGASPNVEVVFFHGLCEGRNYKQEHIEAWSTFDRSGKSICWPEEWLADDFPNARLLSVSYDSRVSEGKLDPFCTAENIIQDLTSRTGGVGQTENCPLILVGRDLGGLIIKAVCLKAHSYAALGQAATYQAATCQAFLKAVNYIIYYCTPHRGLDSIPSHFKTLLAKTLDTRNADTSRLNEDFSMLRKNKTWIAKGLGVTGSSSQGWFGKLIEYNVKNCPEVSARYDVDYYYTLNTEFESVCKPTSRADARYYYLADVIKELPKPEVEPATVWRSTLFFTDDQYFVPMERSFNEVKAALRDFRIVVLHGGPGMGKSSLARYFALRFEEEEAKRRQSQASGSRRAPAALLPVVAFVTCGRSADVINVQEDLLGQLDPEVEYSPQTKHPEKLRQIIAKHLRERNALIVLDDVWDQHLIQEVFVQNSRLKYLITTQRSDLWDSSDSKKVPIQNLDMVNARGILINYAKLDNGGMPEQLQGELDQLIEEVGCHPLALASLGTFAGRGGDQKREAEYWMKLRKSLLEYCRRTSGATVFGERYPSSVYASMMLMIEHGELDDMARKLLCAICLFDGPLIAESVVKSLLLYNDSQTDRDIILKHFDMHTMELTSRNLVQYEKEPIHKHRYRLSSQETEDGKGRGGYRTLLRIHGLRQKFILETLKDEVDELTRFRYQHNGVQYFFGGSKRTDLDLATSLCAIFGEARIKEMAIATMKHFYRWDADSYREANMANAFSILVSLMWIEIAQTDGNGQIKMAATEVFWKFFIQGALDDNHISYLLAQPMCARWTCDFLCESSSSLPSHYQYWMQQRLGEEPVVAPKVVLPLCLERLSGLLDRDVQPSTRDSAILALSHLALVADTLNETLADHELLIDMLLIPGLYDRIMGLTDDLEVSEFLRGVALVTTQSLAGNLDIALGRLTDESAASIFAVLADGPHGVKVIIESDVCLERLALISLERPTNRGNKERALAVLAIVTPIVTTTRFTIDRVTKMLFRTSLLERITPLLYKEKGNRCLFAVAIIGALARACGDRLSNVPQFFFSVESIMRRLAMLVDQDSNVEVQRSAIQAMVEIMICLEDKADMFSPTRCFAARAVMLTNEGNDIWEDQTRIRLAKLIHILSRTQEGVEGLRDCADIFETTLVALMACDQLSSIQSEATICALANITAYNDERLDTAILTCPQFFERITIYLSWTNDVQVKMCIKAIQIIRRLLRRGTSLLAAVSGISACRDKLLELLASDLQGNIHLEAIGALESLEAASRRHQMEALLELCNNEVYEAMYEGVLKCASKDGDQCMCVEAVRIMSRLPWGKGSMPRCLDKLAQLMAEDVDRSVQEAALLTLSNLSCNRLTRSGHGISESRVALLMLECPGLLERVGMTVYHTRITDWLIEVFNRSGFRIGELEIAVGCLKSGRFSQMLAHVDKMVRNVAFSALIHLVEDFYRTIPREDGVSMVAAERLLESLTNLWSENPIAGILIEDIVTRPESKAFILQCPNAMRNLQMEAGILFDNDVEEMMRWRQNDETDRWKYSSERRELYKRRSELALVLTAEEVAQVVLARLYFDDELRVYMSFNRVYISLNRVYMPWNRRTHLLQEAQSKTRPIIWLLLVLNVNNKCSCVSYSYARQVFLNCTEHGQSHEENTLRLRDSYNYGLQMVYYLANCANDANVSSDYSARRFGSRKFYSYGLQMADYFANCANNANVSSDDSARRRFGSKNETFLVGQEVMSLMNTNTLADAKLHSRQLVTSIAHLAYSSEILGAELARFRVPPKELVHYFSFYFTSSSDLDDVRELLELY